MTGGTLVDCVEIPRDPCAHCTTWLSPLSKVEDEPRVVRKVTTKAGRTFASVGEVDFDAIEKVHGSAHSFTLFAKCSTLYCPSLGIIL